MKIYYASLALCALSLSAYADPLAVAACEAVGRITPAELQQIRTSIETGAGRGPAIIEAAKARYMACMALAEAAQIATGVAQAAVVAADLAGEGQK